ncbi:hypothetical protein JAAARDRAFT_118433, partial [Jaapia argillacea MUCL 33604]
MATVQMTDVQFNTLIANLKPGGAKVEKVVAPGTFEGDKREYEDWRDNLDSYLDANSNFYSDDKAKFLYATSLLRGPAAPDQTRVTQLEELISWNYYTREMDKRFGEVNKEEKARIRMMEMKQGTRTANEYITDYNRLILEASIVYPDEVHIDNLKRNATREIVRQI